MDGSNPFTDAFARKLAPPAVEVFNPADEVTKKLRGGVWERSELARGIYTGVLSFGRWLSVLGITPNAITYGALLFAWGSGVAAGLGQYLLSAALLLTSGAFDLLDGVVARAARMTTRFGALLDSTVDRLSDALPLMGLTVASAQRPLVSAVLVVAMMSGFAVSYVRARAEGLGIRLPTLFMRRAERVVLLLAALVVGSLTWPGFPSQAAMISIIAVMAALSLVAAVWALRSAYVVVALDDVARLSAPVAPTPSRP
jgi:CDP-diacylglycerol--glycerol-3-phosphate 3-phosphatidyltransferase